MANLRTGQAAVLFLLAACILVPQALWGLGEKRPEPTAWGHEVLPVESIHTVLLPGVDKDALLAEDKVLDNLGAPLRFAKPLPVDLTPENSGTWEDLDNGESIWRLRVYSPEALSLNFGFTRYQMPEGGRLFIYSANDKRAVGPFTADDNEEHGELWTPILFGDTAVVEVTLPQDARAKLALNLTSVGHDYKGLGRGDLLDKSGTCNVDTLCPVGEPWRRQIRSVALLQRNGSTLCTGFLVNNTARDFKPYFITAAHCGVTTGNAATVVAYWNYENSTCRGEPGGGGVGDGSLSQFMSGSFHRAGYSGSDVTLVELDDRPPSAFKLFWAGWDATGINSTSTIAVHHPSLHTKRISFGQGTTINSYLNPTPPGDGTHHRVIWTLGVTEGGSSGSPIFNQNGHAIGQLHGGPASCSATDKSDYYGRIFTSWTGGGTNSTRLSNWLDTPATGEVAIDGIQRVPTPADFNANGISDVVVYRHGTWVNLPAPAF